MLFVQKPHLSTPVNQFVNIFFSYCIIVYTKLHSLGWTHKVEIEDGVRMLFDWYQDSLK